MASEIASSHCMSMRFRQTPVLLTQDAGDKGF